MTQNLALVSRQEVCKIAGISISTSYLKSNPKSKHYDPDFPKGIQVGPNCVRFVRAEAEEWINAMIQKRRQAHRAEG